MTGSSKLNLRVTKFLVSLSSLRSPVKVRQVGDPVLQCIAQPVDKEFIQTREFKKVTDLMVKTMRINKGVGIAAPQIGESLQIFAMEFSEKHLHAIRKRGIKEEVLQTMEMSVFPLKIFVNPEFKVIDPKIIEFPEGCMSIPGFKGIVPRYRGVELEAMDENGEEVTWKAYGWPARIIQHEVDHLNGTLYIKKMNPETFENLYWKLNA
ncbi:peptide deformylase, mitochondrial-like [Actinia tenebrosa]|uniref:Peptide deformylase n=1 Tax=Actinia tenebrosa TaxID=6105 RepID=A0A6P8HP02_ACTTE|nr:peptide deformylase, mitochondrial-like [Actinia tenebrosa]